MCPLFFVAGPVFRFFLRLVFRPFRRRDAPPARSFTFFQATFIVGSMRLWPSLVFVVLLPACSAPRPSPAPDAKPEPYVRIYDGDSNRVELQIALRKFEPARQKGPAVWLTAVSHIG